ncbi:monocarboxylate transporter 12-like [Mytilus edulis]|uniref:monocarboxylate transporter 12-like n=1 Tax=Mytilus edulis TaxID=6550 RepID=UPI0039F0BCA2
MTKPDRGWAWVVATSSFFAHCISGYFMWASGMVHIVLLDAFDDSLLKTSWVSALFLSLISLAGPLTGVLINRFNCRLSMMVGSLMLTTGLVTTAFVPNINWTFLTFGLLSGTGLGICYNSGLIVLGFNFERKRNLACGFAISGSGIGPFLLTPIFQFIYETYGRTGYFILLGGLSLQYCVCASTFWESEIEKRSKEHKPLQKQRSHDSCRPYISIMRNLPLSCICSCLFLADISVFLLYLHFPKYCLQTNSTKTEISLFMSLAGIWSAIGKLLFGMANNSHDIDETITLFGTFGILGIGTIIFPFFRYEFYAKVIYASILGCYSGCCWIVLNTIVICIIGRERFAHAIGYIMLYCGLGTLFGPPLAGFIVDFGGTYGDSFTAAGVLLLCGAFIGLLSSMCQNKDHDNKDIYLDFEIDIELTEKEQMLNKK